MSRSTLISWTAWKRTHRQSVKPEKKTGYSFRGHRSTQDILEESKRPFVEFTDQMPPLQMGMFDPIDIEEDCGSGCEIA